MPVKVVIGAQWGDEGKGKIVDILSQDADIVARYQGGANAGHTVVHNGKKTVLHLIPSGILTPDCVCILGSGMVIDPSQLLAEIDELSAAGVDVTGRLFVSHQAHLVMPYHKILDSEQEKSLGDKAIGVTGKGIGPAYIDKYRRSGIRIVDLYDKQLFRSKITTACEIVIRTFADQQLQADLDVDQIYDYYIDFDDRIDPLIKDISVFLNTAITEGKNIICEGSQGTLLDIDWGTYPFVTSSNPTAGGAVTGLGIGPTKIDSVLGIIKAYTTRVGQGPFPTEFGEELSYKMLEAGEEYGSTTGRARRCGWFDAVIGRFASRVNGVSSWALTKLDILSQFEAIKICTSYEYKGKVIDVFPTAKKVIDGCVPIYEELRGWQQPISHIRKYADLPAETRGYISRIEELTGTPVEIVSVGSDREETIFKGV